MVLTAEQRKAMVKARKGLQRRIAKRLKLSEPHVSLAIAGKRPASERLKREVARRLKLPVDEVFPPDAQASPAA